MLKVEEEKRLMSHSFILSLFSGMHSKGSSFGRGGGRVRGLQLHVFALTFKAPFSRVAPMRGKSLEITFNCARACLER